MSFDTNVKNYSVEELTSILGLTYPASLSDIQEKSNTYIDKYANNPTMVSFFQNIQSTLEEDIKPDSSNIFNVLVKKDVLNPLLKNVVNRLVNIDSQYRDNTFESIHSTSNDFSSTFFNANLNDTLCNVLSIELDNVVIPKSWYAVDVFYNNNFFWITNNKEDYIIFLESGNYSGTEFVTAMNSALLLAGFTSPTNTFCSYTSTTNMFTFLLNNCSDPSGIEIYINPENNTNQLNEYAYFTFYDTGNVKLYHYIEKNGMQPINVCTLSSTPMDNTLGWLMGFRLPYVSINVDGNKGNYPINLSGPTYFLIVLMDYQTNRMNNEIVTISNKNDPYISIPEYIKADLLYNCIKLESNLIAPVNEHMVDQMIFNLSTSNIPIRQYVPTAPRILTQSQLYTSNEIVKNNAKKTDYRSIGPTNNDVIGLIPVNTQGLREGNVFIQDKIRANKRIFFGPVDIDKFTVRLINDKGQIVNLNGSNWSFTLNVEILYQL